MTKKEMERACVEKAREVCQLFPDGNLKCDEEPDFLIDSGSARLGIEVTQLFHLKGARPFPRREVEEFHRKATLRYDPATGRYSDAAPDPGQQGLPYQ